MALSELAAGAAFTAVSQWILEIGRAGRPPKLRVDTSGAREALLVQLNAMRVWANAITIHGLMRDRALRDAFVDLSLEVGLARYAVHAEAAARATRYAVTLDEPSDQEVMVVVEPETDERPQREWPADGSAGDREAGRRLRRTRDASRKVSRAHLTARAHAGLATPSVGSTGQAPPPVPRGVTVMDVYARGEHLVLLGPPGAGKTTTLQRFAQQAISEWEGARYESRVPILAVLREMGPRETLAPFLLTRLGIRVTAPANLSEHEAREVRAWRLRVLADYLRRVTAVLIVDGLDEVAPDVRREVESELRALALDSAPVGIDDTPASQAAAKPAYRILLSCRITDYAVPIVGVHPYSILPLDPQQVRTFAERWLGSAQQADTFARAVAATPYGGTEVVPLALAHLCILFERNGRLPDRPIEVYEEICNLMLQYWDVQRGIQRPSQFGSFSPPKKARFLQGIAYELARGGQRGSFGHDRLVAAYRLVAPQFQLPADAEVEVLREIESHTGLVQQTGPGRYAFLHLTMQEYLTALHALGSTSARRSLFPMLPNEFALIVAYASTPEDYLLELLDQLEGREPGELEERFLLTLVARLAREAPQFSAWAPVGWILLELLAMVGTPFSPRTGPRPSPWAARMDYVDLFMREDAQAAIGRALREADVHLDARVVRIIPRLRAQLPASMRARLQSRSAAGIAIPRIPPVIVSPLLAFGSVRGLGSTTG